MRSCLALIFLSLFGAATDAQSAKLQPVLVPETVSFADAGSPGVEVFKLLPRGTYKDADGSYKDEDNPLGLRGGGSYYSFSRRSHSYNQVPQIELKAGNLSSGFYGMNYGLFRDLGVVPLSAVSEDSDIGGTIVNYTPPKIRSEVKSEKLRLAEQKTPGMSVRPVSAVAGRTYLLRAISFGEADKLVAFQVVGEAKDGSLTVAWKPIRDFAVPVLLEQPEAELRNKIADVLKDERFSGVEFGVEGNTVRLSGTVNRNDLPALLQATQAARPQKIENKVTIR